MPRAFVLGNGTSLVCLDDFGFVRDFYFPYVGLENHVLGNRHRIGISVDGKFSWLDDGSWSITLGYQPETMIASSVYKHQSWQISIAIETAVYNEADVFIRKIDVYNQADTLRDIKLFFHQVFLINESKKRNTAFFDPTHKSIVHYKGRRVFVVNGQTSDGEEICQYSIGAYDFEGKEGTFRDAEDGELGLNAVEHGSVDSVFRLCLSAQPKEKVTAYYWICAAKVLKDAFDMNQMVLDKTPDGMLHSTEYYWNAWLNKKNFHIGNLSAQAKKLFQTSLFVLRSHIDNRGAIIASADSVMMEYGKDDYSYMWPRDAAFIATTMDMAGFTEVTKPFYAFCRSVLHPDGYLHHRYCSDQSLGSTWHAFISQKEWLETKILQLPIQEDETAGVLFAFWKHYSITKDIEFVEELFKPMIEKMAEFLITFRDAATGLPLPSYDLWEEKIGVSTYTCAAVYGGLMAAAQFAEVLGKRNHMRRYRDVAQSIKLATENHLYNHELESFIRIAYIHDGVITQEPVVDASSAFGLWYFGMLDQTDERLQKTLKRVSERLSNPGEIGGIIRYERDNYFKSTDRSNPWFITTLWEAQRRLKQANISSDDLEFVRKTLNWTAEHVSKSGVLAEQLDPYRGTSDSATPLAWSHSVFVETTLLYIAELEKQHLCTDCEVPKIAEL